jgi:nitrite reductase/ring-hydroxylating ferredoxin subunit
VEAPHPDLDLPQVAAPDTAPSAPASALAPNEFRPADLGPGKMRMLRFDKQDVAIYNVDGVYYATQNDCTHAGGPLAEGDLDGCFVTCPWHGSRFDVCDGKVVRGPANKPLHSYRVVIEGDIGRVIS